jgi:hypothetical protein
LPNGSSRPFGFFLAQPGCGVPRRACAAFFLFSLSRFVSFCRIRSRFRGIEKRDKKRKEETRREAQKRQNAAQARREVPELPGLAILSENFTVGPAGDPIDFISV